MNGTSGFQEVPSSISRASWYRLLHEQRHRYREGTWHLLRTQILHQLIIVAVFGTGFMASGCAYVTHEPVKYHPYPSNGRASDEGKVVKSKNDEEDRKQTGVRYYLSSPYLLVYTESPGLYRW